MNDLIVVKLKLIVKAYFVIRMFSIIFIQEAFYTMKLDFKAILCYVSFMIIDCKKFKVMIWHEL